LGVAAGVGGHFADDYGAGGEVFGAFVSAERGEFVGVEVAVGEAVGVDWVEGGGVDEDPGHGVEVGGGCEADDHCGGLFVYFFNREGIRLLRAMGEYGIWDERRCI
jgi:hypothetical protein